MKIPRIEEVGRDLRGRAQEERGEERGGGRKQVSSLFNDFEYGNLDLSVKWRRDDTRKGRVCVFRVDPLQENATEKKNNREIKMTKKCKFQASKHLVTWPARCQALTFSIGSKPLPKNFA